MLISRPKVVILTDEFPGDAGSCVRLEKLIDPCLRSNLYIPGKNTLTEVQLCFCVSVFYVAEALRESDFRLIISETPNNWAHVKRACSDMTYVFDMIYTSFSLVCVKGLNRSSASHLQSLYLRDGFAVFIAHRESTCIYFKSHPPSTVKVRNTRLVTSTLYIDRA
jgi:hypothetical protein